ncbi:MAG: hypothetical protein AB7O98_03965 [Hyphomonadaceae bacterium]
MPAAAKTKPKAKAKSKPTAAKKRAAPMPVMVSSLAQAAWAEADGALAEALMELAQAQAARNAAERALAMAMLEQAMGRVSRKRGLTRIGVAGATEAYDAKRHAFQGKRPPKTIVVVTPGVARGGEVLAKAHVARPAPTRSKRR